MQSTLDVSIIPNPASNQSPIANIGNPIINGHYVTLDGSQSINPENNPLTYFWNFGDGQTSTDVSPIHTYALDGNYTVSLTVSNGSKSDITSINIAVSAINYPPTVDSAIGNTFVMERENANIVVNASDPDGDPITISALMNSLSLNNFGATLVDNGDGTADFNYIPAIGDAGNYSIVFRADDGTLSSSYNYNLDVTAPVTLPDGIVSVYPDTGSTVDADSVTTIDIFFNRGIYQDMWVTGTLDLYKEGNILIESIDPLASHRINSQTLRVPLIQALEPSTNYYIITSGSKWCEWTENGPPWYTDPIQLGAWVFSTASDAPVTSIDSFTATPTSFPIHTPQAVTLF